MKQLAAILLLGLAAGPAGACDLLGGCSGNNMWGQSRYEQQRQSFEAQERAMANRQRAMREEMEQRQRDHEDRMRELEQRQERQGHEFYWGRR